MIINGKIIHLDSIWYQNVGIIICQDLVTNEYKCYIGTSNLASGNKEADIEYIMMWGNKFPVENGKLLFKHLVFNNVPYKELYPEKFI